MANAIETLLRDLAARVNAELPHALGSLGGPARVQAAMAHSLLAPGKRLRPILVLLAAEAAGGNVNSAMPAAIAVEMVHTYSLIHDDLPAMDDDDLRRGRPTCHKEFGEATAILAGDALLTGAFQVLAEGLPPRVAAACARELARGAGAAGMVGGQAEDLAWEHRAAATADDLQGIHERKTGALFRACLRMGAWTATGAGDTDPLPVVLNALDRYGGAFGLAFQITDDLLDVEGTSGEVGKRVGKDAGRGKLTYPGLLGLEEARRRAAAAVRDAQAAAAALDRAGEPLATLAGYLLERRQ